jgi:gliding motility-associated-like protein
MKNAIKAIAIAALLITSSYALTAQKQNNNWLIYAGGDVQDSAVFVTFNTTPPQSYKLPIPGVNIVFEGRATVSDRNTGELLFFSNGIKIHDRNGNVMPNGNGLLASTFGIHSSSMAAVAVPKPKSTSQYYLFTTDEFQQAYGLRYSVVDMQLNNGLGDIVPGQKNILLQTPTTEKVAAAPSRHGDYYWIITHDADSTNTFRIFRLTECGIDTHVILCQVGLDYNNSHFGGYIKFNPTFTKLAVAMASAPAGFVQVFDFDNSTGLLSNPITLKPSNQYGYTYGVEFSPNGQVLYVTNEFGNSIFQYNLAAGNEQQIIASKYDVPNYLFFQSGSVQLGPDNKIYLTGNNQFQLAYFNQPDSLGVKCQFTEDVDFTIDSAIACPLTSMGLPTPVFFLEPVPIQNDISADSNCIENQVQFTLDYDKEIKRINWDFDDPSTGSLNTSSLVSPAHLFSAPGTYNVSATITYYNCLTETLIKPIVINDCDTLPTDTLPVDTMPVIDTSICKLFMPNAFSPNNDGVNDYFKPLYKCDVGFYEMQIYNRWGELVFQSYDAEVGWDGRYRSVEQPLGVYIYAIKLASLQKPKNYIYQTGSVTLLR